MDCQIKANTAIVSNDNRNMPKIVSALCDFPNDFSYSILAFTLGSVYEIKIYKLKKYWDSFNNFSG